MNKITKFSLTLASALVLTACSGGGSGGGSNNQAPKAQKAPSSRVEQPMAKQSEQPTGKQTKQLTDKQPEQPTGKQPEQPTDKQPEQSEGKQPEQPMEKQLGQPQENRNTDQDVFQRLPKDIAGLASIHLEGKDFELSPYQKVEITDKSLVTLRDNDGKLLGTYGYARALKGEKVNFEEVQKANYAAFLKMDPSAQKTTPTQNMSYDGEMYYAYNDVKQPLTGAVVATYHQANKHVNMLIEADQRDTFNTTWVLGGTQLKLQPVTINSDGNIIGKLYPENGKEANGEFVGAIYGKNGDILVGEANSRHETGENSWKGVIGAKGTVE